MEPEQEFPLEKTSSILDHYVDTSQELEDPRLGVITPMQPKTMVEGNQEFIPTENTPFAQIFRLERCIMDVEEFVAVVEKVEQRLQISHDNVIQMLDYCYSPSNQEHTEFLFAGFYEMSDTDLKREMEFRGRQEKQFTDLEIFNLIKETVNGLVFLQENNLIHGDLRPMYISMSLESEAVDELQTTELEDDSQKFTFKLMDRLGNPLTPQQVQVFNIQEGHDLYLTPHFFESVMQQKECIRYNPYKGDTFALGIMVLKCGLMVDVGDLYSIDEGSFNYELLEEMKAAFINIFSDAILTELLNMLLEVDDSKRLSPIGIQRKMEFILSRLSERPEEMKTIEDQRIEGSLEKDKKIYSESETEESESEESDKESSMESIKESSEKSEKESQKSEIESQKSEMDILESDNESQKEISQRGKEDEEQVTFEDDKEKKFVEEVILKDEEDQKEHEDKLETEEREEEGDRKEEEEGVDQKVEKEEEEEVTQVEIENHENIENEDVKEDSVNNEENIENEDKENSQIENEENVENKKEDSEKVEMEKNEEILNEDIGEKKGEMEMEEDDQGKGEMEEEVEIEKEEDQGEIKQIEDQESEVEQNEVEIENEVEVTLEEKEEGEEGKGDDIEQHQEFIELENKEEMENSEEEIQPEKEEENEVEQETEKEEEKIENIENIKEEEPEIEVEIVREKLEQSEQEEAKENKPEDDIQNDEQEMEEMFIAKPEYDDFEEEEEGLQLAFNRKRKGVEVQGNIEQNEEEPVEEVIEFNFTEPGIPENVKNAVIEKEEVFQEMIFVGPSQEESLIEEPSLEEEEVIEQEFENDNESFQEEVHEEFIMKSLDRGPKEETEDDEDVQVVEEIINIQPSREESELEEPSEDEQFDNQFNRGGEGVEVQEGELEGMGSEGQIMEEFKERVQELEKGDEEDEEVVVEEVIIQKEEESELEEPSEEEIENILNIPQEEGVEVGQPIEDNDEIEKRENTQEEVIQIEEPYKESLEKMDEIKLEELQCKVDSEEIEDNVVRLNTEGVIQIVHGIHETDKKSEQEAPILFEEENIEDMVTGFDPRIHSKKENENESEEQEQIEEPEEVEEVELNEKESDKDIEGEIEDIPITRYSEDHVEEIQIEPEQENEEEKEEEIVVEEVDMNQKEHQPENLIEIVQDRNVFEEEPQSEDQPHFGTKQDQNGREEECEVEEITLTNDAPAMINLEMTIEESPMVQFKRSLKAMVLNEASMNKTEENPELNPDPVEKIQLKPQDEPDIEYQPNENQEVVELPMPSQPNTLLNSDKLVKENSLPMQEIQKEMDHPEAKYEYKEPIPEMDRQYMDKVYQHYQHKHAKQPPTQEVMPVQVSMETSGQQIQVEQVPHYTEIPTISSTLHKLSQTPHVQVVTTEQPYLPVEENTYSESNQFQRIKERYFPKPLATEVVQENPIAQITPQTTSTIRVETSNMNPVTSTYHHVSTTPQAYNPNPSKQYQSLTREIMTSPTPQINENEQDFNKKYKPESDIIAKVPKYQMEPVRVQYQTEQNYQTEPVRVKYQTEQHFQTEPNIVQYQPEQNFQTEPNIVQYQPEQNFQTDPNIVQYQPEQNFQTEPIRTQYQPQQNFQTEPNRVQYQTEQVYQMEPVQVQYQTEQAYKTEPNRVLYQTEQVYQTPKRVSLPKTSEHKTSVNKNPNEILGEELPLTSIIKDPSRLTQSIQIFRNKASNNKRIVLTNSRRFNKYSNLGTGEKTTSSLWRSQDHRSVPIKKKPQFSEKRTPVVKHEVMARQHSVSANTHYLSKPKHISVNNGPVYRDASPRITLENKTNMLSSSVPDNKMISHEVIKRNGVTPEGDYKIHFQPSETVTKYISVQPGNIMESQVQVTRKTSYPSNSGSVALRPSLTTRQPQNSLPWTEKTMTTNHRVSYQSRTSKPLTNSFYPNTIKYTNNEEVKTRTNYPKNDEYNFQSNAYHAPGLPKESIVLSRQINPNIQSRFSENQTSSFDITPMKKNYKSVGLSNKHIDFKKRISSNIGSNNFPSTVQYRTKGQISEAEVRNSVPKVIKSRIQNFKSGGFSDKKY